MKYKVTLSVNRTYEIEANDEDTAVLKACELFNEAEAEIFVEEGGK